MDKVAILLVLYNDSHHLPRLIESIKKQTYINFEIYAIETSVSGDSITLLKELYPQVKSFSYQGNLGFASGNNFLAKEACKNGADYLFVLNTDMELSSNTLEVFLTYFKEDQNIGVVSSCLMQGETNKIQLFGAKANFKTQKKEFIYPNKNINEINLPEVLEVDYVNGGSTFLSRKVYEEVGLFNVDFFMYNDEIEFAYKVRNAGFKTIVTSKTIIRHHHAWSPGNNSSYYIMYYYMMRNKYLYFKKHKLFFSMTLDFIKLILMLPVTLKWAVKLAGFKLAHYYYLGVFHGLLGKKGVANINFQK